MLLESAVCFALCFAAQFHLQSDNAARNAMRNECRTAQTTSSAPPAQTTSSAPPACGYSGLDVAPDAPPVGGLGLLAYGACEEYAGSSADGKFGSFVATDGAAFCADSGVRRQHVLLPLLQAATTRDDVHAAVVTVLCANAPAVRNLEVQIAAPVVAVGAALLDASQRHGGGAGAATPPPLSASRRSRILDVLAAADAHVLRARALEVLYPLLEPQRHGVDFSADLSALGCAASGFSGAVMAYGVGLGDLIHRFRGEPSMKHVAEAALRVLERAAQGGGLSEGFLRDSAAPSIAAALAQAFAHENLLKRARRELRILAKAGAPDGRQGWLLHEFKSWIAHGLDDRWSFYLFDAGQNADGDEYSARERFSFFRFLLEHDPLQYAGMPIDIFGGGSSTNARGRQAREKLVRFVERTEQMIERHRSHSAQDPTAAPLDTSSSSAAASSSHAALANGAEMRDAAEYRQLAGGLTAVEKGIVEGHKLAVRTSSDVAVRSHEAELVASLGGVMGGDGGAAGHTNCHTNCHTPADLPVRRSALEALLRAPDLLRKHRDTAVVPSLRVFERALRAPEPAVAGFAFHFLYPTLPLVAKALHPGGADDKAGVKGQMDELKRALPAFFDELETRRREGRDPASIPGYKEAYAEVSHGKRKSRSVHENTGANAWGFQDKAVDLGPMPSPRNAAGSRPSSKWNS